MAMKKEALTNLIADDLASRNDNWTEIDTTFELKADKTYVDTQDLLKADKATTYTKTEVDTSLGLKADTTYVDNRIDNIIATPIDLPEIYVDEIHDARQGAGSLGANIAEVKSQLAESSSYLRNVKADVWGGFIAHRGLCSVAPENSLKAISEAGRRGFARVEIDPRITSDGYWVLMHDDTVDRTTDGVGTVASKTLAEIQGLKIDIPIEQILPEEVIRVPLFEDALKEAAIHQMGTNIDGAKFYWTESHFQYLVGLLIKYNLLDKSWIYFTNKNQRISSNQYVPELAIAWTTSPVYIDADLEEAKSYKNAILIYHFSDLTPSLIEKINKANVGVMAYRCDTTDSAYNLYNMGVRFIETDFVLPGGMF